MKRRIPEGYQSPFTMSMEKPNLDDFADLELTNTQQYREIAAAVLKWEMSSLDPHGARNL